MAVEIICMFSLEFMKTLVFHSAQDLWHNTCDRKCCECYV
jgi:hypothetical protein